MELSMTATELAQWQNQVARFTENEVKARSQKAAALAQTDAEKRSQGFTHRVDAIIDARKLSWYTIGRQEDDSIRTVLLRRGSKGREQFTVTEL